MEINLRKVGTRPVYPSRPVPLAVPSRSALLRNLNGRAFHGPCPGTSVNSTAIAVTGMGGIPRAQTDGGTDEKGVEMRGKPKRRRSGQQGDEGEERMKRKMVEKARTEREGNRAEPTGEEQGRWGKLIGTGRRAAESDDGREMQPTVGREGRGREIDGRSVVKGARIGRSDVHLHDVSKSDRGRRWLRVQR
ncbi:hypothetical protein C8R45DRAFT_1011916 [Mycena sanguinolenta]|nr:hypothetical protein C8R45DRAFT_1011916 [Mycena sanguinolenta]